MKRTAQAQWTGNAKEGHGTLTTPSGVLHKTNYSFKSRFTEGEKGTNPEELLAAAHAGCFTMAVGFALAEKGITPTSLDTTATVRMEGLEITSVHLAIKGEVEGISLEEFKNIVKLAEQDCLISKALKIQISSEAILHTK